jgi:hypothetical protein
MDTSVKLDTLVKMDTSVNDSVKQLIEYYRLNGITDYPKTKDGKPKMNCKLNKDTLLIIKQNNMNDNGCPICKEPLKDNCTLVCNHTFCVPCSIYHFRNNTTCPLCRNEICDKPKKTEPMTSDMVQEEIENILMTEEPDRKNMTMYDYVSAKLEYYKYNSVLNKERYMNDIYDEITQCMIDYNAKVEEWYK